MECALAEHNNIFRRAIKSNQELRIPPEMAVNKTVLKSTLLLKQKKFMAVVSVSVGMTCKLLC